MTKQAEFTGFPKSTQAFLAALAEHNDRDWFEAHRADYEQHYLAPARAFVTAIGPALRKFAKGVRTEPRVNGSLMRINRDTRFSADKTPYKTNLDLMFWEGEGRSRECPGFFFRLTANQLMLGAGKHGFAPDELARYREAVADGRRGAALTRAIVGVQAAGGYQLGGAHYKRVPRGYPADHPRADLLRHNGLYVWIELLTPAEVHTAALVPLSAGHFRAMAPVHRWLVALQG